MQTSNDDSDHDLELEQQLAAREQQHQQQQHLQQQHLQQQQQLQLQQQQQHMQQQQFQQQQGGMAQGQFPGMGFQQPMQMMGMPFGMPFNMQHQAGIRPFGLSGPMGPMLGPGVQGMGHMHPQMQMQMQMMRPQFMPQQVCNLSSRALLICVVNNLLKTGMGWPGLDDVKAVPVESCLLIHGCMRDGGPVTWFSALMSVSAKAGQSSWSSVIACILCCIYRSNDVCLSPLIHDPYYACLPYLYLAAASSLECGLCRGCLFSTEGYI